jgi:CBS domain-containing protein
VLSEEGLFDWTFYKPSPDDHILPWQFFTRDFESQDLVFDNVIETLIDVNRGAKLDFRPYLIENPMTVATTDSLKKCNDLFRKMHLRHLIVVNPSDGKPAGIITRADLFTYLDL